MVRLGVLSKHIIPIYTSSPTTTESLKKTFILAQLKKEINFKMIMWLLTAPRHATRQISFKDTIKGGISPGICISSMLTHFTWGNLLSQPIDLSLDRVELSKSYSIASLGIALIPGS